MPRKSKRHPVPLDPDRSRDARESRTLNVFVVVVTCVVLAAGGAGLYVWHSYQLDRSSESLLDQARELAAAAEKKQDVEGYARAAELLYRYTQIRPDDTDAQIRLAELQGQRARDENPNRAINLLYQALALAEDEAKRHSLGKSLIELLIQEGRYFEAQKQIEKLLGSHDQPLVTDELDTDRLLGLAIFGRFRIGEIPTPELPVEVNRMVTSLRRSLAREVDPQLAEILAFVLRSDETQFVVYAPRSETASDVEATKPMAMAARIAEADAVMDRLVAERPKDAMAWLSRSNYRKIHDEPTGSASDLARALELGRDNIAVHLYAGERARAEAVKLLKEDDLVPMPEATDSHLSDKQQRTVAQARSLLEASLEQYRIVVEKLDPTNEIAIIGLGRSSILLGDETTAERLWLSALNTKKLDSFALRYYLAEHYLRSEQFDDVKELPGLMSWLESRVKRLQQGSGGNSFEPLARSFELMKARWLIGRQRPAEALPLLERITAGRPESAAESVEHCQALVLLGSYYEKVGSPDLAAQSFENAAQLATAPRARAAALLNAARAWEAAGALERATFMCERSVAARPTSDALLLLARVVLTRQEMRDANDQEWTAFEKTLTTLRELSTNGQLASPWQLTLLECEADLVRATNEEEKLAARRLAYQSAKQLEEDFANDASLMRRLVFLYEGLEHQEDADRSLRKFQGLESDPVLNRIVQSRLRYRRQQYPEAMSCLNELTDDYSRDDHILIEKSKAQIAIAQQNLDQAAAVLAKLAEDYPDDLSITRSRAQVARQLDDFETIQDLEKTLGGGQLHDRSWAMATKIRRLLVEASSDSEPDFFEAMSLLDQLEAVRPDWSMVYKLRGELEEKRGSFLPTAGGTQRDEAKRRLLLDQAVRFYERAVQLGDRSLDVYERLVNALYQVGRFDDAASYLRRIENAVPVSSTLSEVAINLAVRNDSQDQALAVARRAMQRRPDDVMARVWYGLLLMSSQQDEEAERVLLEAVRTAPRDDRPWNGLFTFYVRTGNTEKARSTFADMIAQAAMSAGRKASVLAQGYEALGDDLEAERSYLDAVAQTQDSAEAWRGLARFYFSGALVGKPGFQQKAINTLTQMQEKGIGDEQAQRTLILLLAGEGGDRWREAQELLDGMTTGDESNAVNRRFKGVLLFQRSGEGNLNKAREIFQQLVDSPDGEPQDKLYLARILERLGDYAGSRNVFQQIAVEKPPYTQGLTYYVDFLLRRNELAEAEQWLNVLKQALGQEFDMNVLRVQARFLNAQGRAAEVPQLVDRPVTNRLATLRTTDIGGRSTLMLATGNLYTELRLYTAAEKWYRQLADLDNAGIAYLAICLARQDRVAEAVETCTNAASRLDSASVARILSSVLAVGKPTNDEFARAEPLLRAAEAENENDAGLLMDLANVHIVRGNLDDAVRLLEKSVTLDSHNVAALNNLAMVLSEQPEMLDKALEYIDRALDVTGPRPDLYDTKASILIYSDRPAEAIPLLEFVLRTASNDPRFKFHLAAAYFKLNEQERSQKYFEEALREGLEDQILSGPDRELIAEMKSL